MEDVLRGYVDYFHEYSIDNIESFLLKFANNKLKYILTSHITGNFNSFEEACQIRQSKIMNTPASNLNSPIMIADDNYFSRSSLVYMMNYNGYNNIIEVENGQDVL